jgi:hypothetical protein
LNICVYESPQHPNVAVLRLASFQYRANAKGSKFESLQSEVDQFYDGYWKAKAPSTKKLIIDVIDNGGGDTPVPWYQIFYSKPFQEQYVQFKKTPEFENESIRQNLFYEDGSKEVWLNELKKSGAYQKIKMGEFLPPVPQFCASAEDESCDRGLFSVRENGFKGDIRILVNEYCISSCTGFVWSLKDQLGKRVKLLGVGDSGDSAYARLFLDVYLDENSHEGFRVEVSGRTGSTQQKLPDGAMFRQQITATRSTTKQGKILSATPSKVDQWISYKYRDYDDTWEASLFKAALTK